MSDVPVSSPRHLELELRFWIGHADKNVADGYSKVKEDVEFRKECVRKAGRSGFSFPQKFEGKTLKLYPLVLKMLEKTVV